MLPEGVNAQWTDAGEGVEPLFASPFPREASADEILAEVKALREEHAKTAALLGEVVTLVTDVVAQVKPAIEGLAGNPLFAMLGKGKRNG